MKKLIVMAGTIALSSFAFESFAQEVAVSEVSVSTSPQNVKQAPPVKQSTEKVAVKKEELPEAIQNVLNSDAMQGAEFVSAYLLKGEKAVYEITVRKDGQEATFKMDDTGTIVQ